MQLSQQAVLIRVKRFMWCIPIAKKGEEGRKAAKKAGGREAEKWEVGRQRSGSREEERQRSGSREEGREEGREGGREDQDTPKLIC